MTTSPNEMSDEELYQSITDICFESGGVTKPMADKLLLLIKQHREAYALELIGDDEPQSENGLLPDRVDRRNQLRAELRKKVGRDDTK